MTEVLELQDNDEDAKLIYQLKENLSEVEKQKRSLKSQIENLSEEIISLKEEAMKEERVAKFREDDLQQQVISLERQIK